MDMNSWMRILIGLRAGGGAVRYVTLRPLHTAVVTLAGEYRNAEKGRRKLEA